MLFARSLTASVAKFRFNRIKLARKIAVVLTTAAIVASQFGPLARATVYYWDNNGATAGFGAAAGTWAAPTTGSSTQGWSTSTTGATLPASVTTATTDTVNFGNTTTGLATGSITVSGTVDNGGITFASGSGAITLTGGTINSVAAETVTVNNASDTINSNLTGAATSFTKAGTGTLFLGGTNTYTGTTTISAGVLVANSAGAIPGGLAFGGSGIQLSLNGGVLGLGAGDFTRTATSTSGTAGTVRFATNGGFAAYGADRIVNFGGSATPTQANWSSGFNGKTLILGATTATNKVTVVNPLTVTTVTRPVQVDDGAAAIDGQLSGVISESGTLAGLSKTGTGTLALTGASTFTGNVSVSAGTVVVNSLTNSGTASPIGQGTYGVALNGGTFQYAPIAAAGGGAVSVNRNFIVAASSSLDASGTGALVYTAPTGSTVSPDISAVGFTALGTDKVLTVASVVPGLAIGMAVTGPGIAAGSTIASIVGSTTTVITLTSTANVTSTTGSANFGFATARTLTLTGTNTGGNQISGNFADSSAAGAGVLGIAKSGVGSWTLAGANTYTGNTTVTGGTLNITGGYTGNTTSSTLAIGTAAANTVVNVSSDMTLFAFTGAAIAGSASVYNQTAGNVVISSPSLNGSNVASIGYGYFNLTGGTFKSNGGFGIGASGSTTSAAVAYVGGTGSLDWSGANNQTLSYTSGASLTVGPGGSVSRGASANTTWLATNSGSSGTVNIAGGSLDLGTAGNLYVNNTASGGTSVTFNLASGTLAIGKSLGTNGSTSGSLYANYAGGKLLASANLTSPFNVLTSVSTIFGPITNNNSVNTAFNTQIGSTSNFTGGLTIDSNGNSVTYGNALLGATGSGVAQANITVTGGSGYIGAPLVQFTGGTLAANGSPASGYAVISGGAVTGIVITSPGEYTVDPTVALTGGGGTGASVALSALTANVADSGLTKINGGTLTLTATNTYAGATTVTGGILTFSGSGSSNLSSGIIVNGSGVKLLQRSSAAIAPAVTLTQGTLTGSGTVNTVLVGNGTGGIVSNNDGVAGAVLNIGSLTFSGAATVNVFSNSASAPIATTSLASDAAGTVTINPTAASWISGTSYDLISYGGGSIGGAGFGQFSLGSVSGFNARQSGVLANSGTAITLAVTGDAPYWVGDGDGNWNLTSTNNWKLLGAGTYTQFLTGDDVLFNDNATSAGPVNVIIDAAAVAPKSTTFNNSTKDYVLTGTQGISAGSLTKNGTGTVNIGTLNTYTGPTTINAGTLLMSGTGTLGGGSALTLAGGSLNLGTTSQTVGAVAITAPAASGDTISNGSLTGTSYAASNASGNAIISANLLASGAAGFTMTGAGSVTLKGANTYTGPTAINAGTVLVTGSGTLGTGAALTLAGGNLDLGTTSQTVGAVSVTAAPASGETISNGSLSGTSYAVSNTTGTAIISANLLANGTAGFSKTGAGTVTLSGTNTFTGPVTLTGGTVVMANTQSLGLPTGIVTLNGGVILDIATAGGDTPYRITSSSVNSATIISDVATGSIGINHTLGDANIGGSTTAGVTQINVIAGAGITTGSPSITLGAVNMSAGAASAVISTYNPTSANLIIGSVTNSNGSATNTRTLNLDGTSTGNQITGIISDGATAPTVITKTNTSTWTLAGANTYVGATTVSAGTLILSGNRTVTSGAITVGNLSGSTATLNVSNGTFSTGTFAVGTSVGVINAVGVVNQTGGTLTLTGTQLIIGNGGASGTPAGQGGVGTYNLSGGTLTATSVANRGVMLGTNDGGTSTFNLSGTGTLALTGALSRLMVGRSDSPVVNTTNLFNQTGGTANVSILTIGGAAAAATGLNSTFTVTGGTFIATTFADLGVGNSGVVTMNIGGTAAVTLPNLPTVHGIGTTTTINLDGGTLKNSATGTFISGLTNTFIKAGGAAFDTTLNSTTISQNLLTDATSLGGGLTKAGTNSLTLSGVNTYTGVTNVQAGTLALGATGSINNSSLIALTPGATFDVSAVSGYASAQNLAAKGAGTASIVGAVDAGARTLDLKDGINIGTLALNSGLNLNGGTLTFDLSSTSSDQITIAGAATLAGTNTINVAALTAAASLATGTHAYTLITAGSGLNSSNFALSNPTITVNSIMYNLALSGDTSNQYLDVLAAPTTVNGTWNVDASGSYSTPGNWSGGVPGLGANSAGNDTATFAAAATTANPVVTLDGVSPVLKGITFNNAAHGYTIAQGTGGTLTLNGGASPATVDVTNGTHTISAPLTLATNTNITLANAGSLTLSGAQAWAGHNVAVSGAGTITISGTQSNASPATFTVNTGVTANINTDGGTGLSLVNGGVTNLKSSQTLAGVTINNGAHVNVTTNTAQPVATGPSVLVTPSLSIASHVVGSDTIWDGYLDLANNKLVVQTGGLSGTALQAAVQQVASQVRSGYNLANGSSTLWMGTGIGSSSAAADTRRIVGLAVFQNNTKSFGSIDGTVSDGTGNAFITTPFGGATVAKNDTLVKFTYFGDTDLDGVITAGDYANIDLAFAHQQTLGPQSGWANGDFDYDGSITAADYSLMDSAFAAQSGALAEGVHTLGGSLSGSLGSVTAVPEPSTWLLGVLGIIGLLAMARRRRMQTAK